MKIFLFLFIVLLISINFCFCQNTTQPNDLDNVYTPPIGSLFDNNASKNLNSSARNSSGTQLKNIILFNIVSLIRSNVYITYERALAERFSVIGGLGRYFGRDMLGTVGTELMDEILSSDSENRSHYRAIWDASNTDFTSGGIQVGVAGRYYFDDDFNERSYFEFGSRFYQWYFKAKSPVGSSSSVFYGSPEFVIYNQLYYLSYGKQWNSGDKIKFSHEFYYGAGIRLYSSDGLKETTGNNGSNSIYQLTNERHHFKTISLLLGYKLGIGW